MPKSPENTGTGTKPGNASREERLARALRANLHRRKAQARGRGGTRRPPRTGGSGRGGADG